MKAVAANRWRSAQDYERRWWEARGGESDLAYLRTYAQTVADALSSCHRFGPDSVVLEIGSGPAGILTHLLGARRIGVDPLEEFFAGVPGWRSQRDPTVRYAAAIGEQLPFADNCFNVIVCDNVLDHCADPGQVVREMARTLRPGGCAYLRCSVYVLTGRVVRRLLEAARIDRGHPHTFSPSDLERIVSRSGLTIRSVRSEGLFKSWWRDLRSGNIRRMAKALLLSSADKRAWVVCKSSIEGKPGF